MLIGKTEFVATSQTNIVKAALIASRKEAASILGIDADSITVDSPVPYCLEKFRAYIDADKPSQPSRQESHNSILQKLDVLRSDGRLRFMWANWDSADGDEFVSVIAEILDSELPPKVVDLSGVPNEVAGVASAAIARTLFNLKVWQNEEERENNPVLLVCEEAHRYVPNRGEAQYGEAQESIRRVAKEGRKYGVGMVLVSQRPSEVESTVLSQCSTWIVLRVTNETDRSYIRGVLPDSLVGFTKVLSGLRRQEAIFVGQAATLPSRIMIRELAKCDLPSSKDIDFDVGWQAEIDLNEHLKEIAERWRYQRRSGEPMNRRGVSECQEA